MAISCVAEGGRCETGRREVVANGGRSHVTRWFDLPIKACCSIIRAYAFAPRCCRLHCSGCSHPAGSSHCHQCMSHTQWHYWHTPRRVYKSASEVKSGINEKMLPPRLSNAASNFKRRRRRLRTLAESNTDRKCGKYEVV